MRELPDLTWPVATLAFAKAGSGERSFPVEVGLCVWHSPEDPPAAWSTLIRPAPGWLAGGDPDAGADAAPGLSRHDLAKGATPTEVVASVMARLPAAGVAWCDGGALDVRLARTLALASGARLRIGLGHLGILAAGWPSGPALLMRAHLDAHAVVGRAGPDAERLLRALALAVGVRPAPLVYLKQG